MSHDQLTQANIVANMTTHVVIAPTEVPRSDVLDFVVDLTWDEVPDQVRRRLALLCLDISVAAEAGSRLTASRIITDYVSTAMAGTESTCLYDGRRTSAAGAALANGTMMNAVDYDDGHSLAKGHPGAVIIPAALAVAEATGASHEEFLLATLIGYEVGIRAAMAQHDRWPLFHSSGTWGAIGAAAACARLLGLDREQVDAALGLAEYHSPVDLIMRAVAEPTMAKDAMGWGAHVGVTSAQLAAAGFTAHRSEFIAGRSAAADLDLGRTWQLMEIYVKPFPCCRWVHPSLAAAAQVLNALGSDHIDPDSLARVRVRTFQAAADLARVIPTTSEQAQFNLIWPLATFVTTGAFGLDSITRDLGDPAIGRIAGLIEIVVDPELEAGFPAVRRSSVEITLSDGRTISSGPCSAAGNPDDPQWEDVVRNKFTSVSDESWAWLSSTPLTGITADLMSLDPTRPLTYPLTGPAEKEHPTTP